MLKKPITVLLREINFEVVINVCTLKNAGFKIISV